MKDITNGEIEVKCPECGRSGRGERVSHSGFSPRFSVAENFYCEFCDARFSHWVGRPWEMVSQYRDSTEEYECGLCGRHYLVHSSEIRVTYGLPDGSSKGKVIISPICKCGNLLSRKSPTKQTTKETITIAINKEEAK